jgi:hypothetical protein
VLNQEDLEFVDLILQGTKKIFFHFKYYNLAIDVVNVFENVSTYDLNSLRQEPMVGSQKEIKKFNFAICIKSGSFELFSSKT